VRRLHEAGQFRGGNQGPLSDVQRYSLCPGKSWNGNGETLPEPVVVIREFEIRRNSRRVGSNVGFELRAALHSLPREKAFPL
jgi:hypothetical protein